MKPLEKVYWLRLILGVIAALLCTGYAIATNNIPHVPQGQLFPQPDYLFFFNSLALAIIVYMFSYYYVKSKFGTQVQKVSKLVTTGIGIYFLAWITVYVIAYTAIAIY